MRARYFALAALAGVLCVCQSYTLRGSVSWAASSSVVAEDADLSEEIAPSLLVDSAGRWKQAYPSSDALRDGEEKPGELDKDEGVAQLSSRLFSYRLEKVKSANSSPPPPPLPPHQDTARAARYIAHYSDWGHLATISTQDKIRGLPFGNLYSVSDGPLDNSTGVLYFYVTPRDTTVSDLKSNPYASLTLSESEGEICRETMYNPEVPTCARLTLTGKMVEVAPEELEFAKQAMFSRHPAMSTWPVTHKWFFMKMELIQVWLQDWIAGTSVIELEDYFKATPF